MSKKVNIRLHNAMIEVAVCEFWEKKITETDWSKNGGHSFSDRHTKTVSRIIRKHKAKLLRTKLFIAAKRVAAVILILTAITSFVLASSAQAREIAMRIRSNIVELFRQEHPNAPLHGDEFQDFQTDRQIAQLETAVSYALEQVELPPDTSFQILIDGWHNLTIQGLNESDTAKIMPYIEPMAAILSTAYSSENKNQIYYIQMIIKNYEEIKDDTSNDWFDTIREYRSIIREYIFSHDNITTDEIMAAQRVINYTGGKLIFEEK